MSELLDKLTSVAETCNENEIVCTLKRISEKKQESPLELPNSLVVESLLAIKNNPEIIKLSLEFVAEVARDDTNRNVLTKEELINNITELLRSEDPDVVCNAIRALGNICYQNENACEFVVNKGRILLALLEDDDVRKNGQITEKLLALFVNLCSLNDGFVKASLEIGLADILDKLLAKYSKAFINDQKKNHDLMMFLLTVLSTVSEYFIEKCIVFKEESCKMVVDVFKASDSPKVSVACLEVFHLQTERDEIKFLLAKEGVCELLFELIEKHRHDVNDEESRSTLKFACDLIVVILTGDDCMYLLYNDGEGRLYKNMITWLDTDDEDLVSTGVLAIGNFARKDNHCIQMVKNGISKKLIEILKRYNTSASDFKMQHAILSTLKNLAIPKPNKSQMLQEGLIDVIYPMIKIDQYFVVFKLVGTFRMVIDGQETAALNLIQRVDFIERLVQWCYHSEHLGVRGEVPRLLSWLIKNCHSFKPFSNFINVQGSVKCLVEMFSSNHALMHNEALLALNLLCVGCAHLDAESKSQEKTEQEKLMSLLIDADIGKSLGFILTKYGVKMDKNTVENILTFLEHIIKFNVIIKHLKTDDFLLSLQKLQENSNLAGVMEVTQRLEAIVELLKG